MIKRTDICTTVNLLLKSKYPSYKTYGHEVVEGFDKPSFFVNLVPNTISNESVNYKKYSYSIVITYFQDRPNEIDNLNKADEIQALFGYHLKVGDKLLAITDFDYEFVGEYTNILQMSFEMEYMEYNQKQQPETATELNLKVEKR